MNILIIEDDQLLRRAISHCLTESGHTVATAANGLEAIGHFETNTNIDMIICDVMMPVLTGPSLILMLKKYFLHSMPVIMIISSVKEGEDFLKKIEIKYNYFIPKPIDFNYLKEVIDNVAALK